MPVLSVVNADRSTESGFQAVLLEGPAAVVPQVAEDLRGTAILVGRR